MIDFFVHSFNTLSHGLLGYAVPFLFVLTIVVFFHELGHFLVARWAGVRVLTFSLGFGPELVGFNDRHGTRWKISAIPLGGYVKFFGDESEASTPSAAIARGHDRRGARRQLPSQEGRPARRYRRGRTDRQFHPRRADFRGHGLVLWQAEHDRACRRHRGRRRGGFCRLQGRGRRRADRRQADRELCGHAANRGDERGFRARSSR